MKRYLLIIIIILCIFCSNIMVFAQENESEAYEIPTEENSELSGNSDITDEELESAIIIGSGTEEQINTTFLDEFAVYYFSQLNKNFGNNYIGSCSYTAAAMLLSFYDTYWNDNIIPEHYESQDKNFPNTKLIEDISESPGIKWKYIPLGTTEEQYETIIENYKEEYFHLKLIDIGLNLFDDYALFPSSVEELLEHYLYNVAGFTTSEVTVERITAGNLFDGTTVREYVINKVTQGIPVFVSATSLDEGAHSYIIYDYDASTDELYCHLGWYEDTENDKKYTHVAFSTLDYTLFEGAVTINCTPNSQHSHSNNYVDSAGNTYCSCYFSCHPEHECKYYKEYNEEYHTYVCDCADEILLFPHNYVCNGKSGSTHHEICSDCGYEQVGFTNGEFSSINELKHLKTCPDCSYYQNKLHTFTYTNTGDGDHKVVCQECGYEGYKSHNFEYSDYNNYKHTVSCINCSYTGTLPHNYTCNGTIDGTHYEICTDCGREHSGRSSTQFTSINASQHSAKCLVCGYESTPLNHNFEYRIVSDTHHEKYCVDCEYVAFQEMHVVKTTEGNGKFKKCYLCGAMVNTGGGNIFPVTPTKKEELEEQETE